MSLLAIIDNQPRIPLRVGVSDGEYMSLAPGYIKKGAELQPLPFDSKHRHLIPSGQGVNIHQAPPDVELWIARNQLKTSALSVIELTVGSNAARWHSPPRF